MNLLIDQRSASAAVNQVELSVVVPTFKERGNVAELVRRLDLALAGVRWEAIFVDDNSPDGTAAAVKEIGMGDPRVRCLLRIGRRGLAGACIEGMLSSAAPFVAVIDADLQHDERVLPKMLEKLRDGKTDLVAATRYVEGGSAKEGFSEKRNALSRLATSMTRGILGTSLSDPMSGFFMMRRDRFDTLADKLSPVGFKILLDIVTADHRLVIAEQPYSFGERFDGESKFDSQIGMEFLGLLLTKATGGVLDPRFLYFALVGLSGVFVNVVALFLLQAFTDWTFGPAEAWAIFIAMVSNFFLNNKLTYRDRRLKGWALVPGFLGFCLVGSLGALANFAVARWLLETMGIVWFAALTGALLGALWNYSMSTLFVWRAR
jgi:dolichol-phosphate mannosyltransferase